MEETLSKKAPLISVVMANYNNAQFLSEAIESVLAQTYSNFEFFIVDDGSADNSSEVIKTYLEKDSRIRYIQNEKNLGQSLTRNVAIERAIGKYIAIVDSDDRCHAERLEKQIAFMESHPEVGVLGTSYIVLDTGGIELSKRAMNDPAIMIRSGKVPVHNPTCMIRGDVFKKHGYFNPGFDHAEDVDLYFRWYGQGVCFENMDQYLYEYRIHGKNTSATRIKKQVWLLFIINLRSIFVYGVRFSFAGYCYVAEQLFYFIYLSFGLDKIYQKGNTNLK